MSTTTEIRTVTKSVSKVPITYDTQDKLFYVLYFVGRYLVVCTSYFLCIISTLYAIGSLTTLEVSNLFCPVYTKEEIRTYNKINGNQYGASERSCYYIDRTRLNLDNIFQLNISLFSAEFGENITFVSVLVSILYFIVTTILILPTIYHTYYLIYDTFFALRSYILGEIIINPRVYRWLQKLTQKYGKKNDRSSNIKKKSIKIIEKKIRSGSNICCLISCYINGMRSCTRCYFEYINPLYYVDSKLRLLSLIFREWIEITIQFYALMLYGGVNLFDSNSNVLSQSPNVVLSFAVIISLNAIIGMFSCIIVKLFLQTKDKHCTPKKNNI